VEEAAASFETFNLDLMYALPGQTLAQLEADVTQALALMPPHLSIYHLTIEPNTYFAKFPPVTPPEDLAYAMLDRITEMTTATGLERYEVSAYAKPGHRCWHNFNYWSFGDYLGIGAGRAQQDQLSRIAWCGRCAIREPSSTWTTRWPATRSRRTKKCPAASCRSSSCSMPCD
jgi:coproporphyrinogen III oxidase-like Fe-S oxidoreductase